MAVHNARTVSETDGGQLFLTINGKQAGILNKLLATGFFGSTAAGCALRLLDEKLIEKAIAFGIADEATVKATRKST